MLTFIIFGVCVRHKHLTIHCGAYSVYATDCHSAEAAQLCPVRTSLAQLDPAGTNPSSPPLNHCAVNKGRWQYITDMWQALALMTLRILLGL